MRPDSWIGEVWVENNSMTWNMYFHESDKMGSPIRKCSKHFLEARTCMEEKSRHQGRHLCRSSLRKYTLIRMKPTHMNCNDLFWACWSPTHSFLPFYLPTCSPAQRWLCVTTDLPILPTCHLSIYPSIHPPIYSPIHPTTYPCIYLSLYHPFRYPSTYPHTHPSLHPSTQPSNCLLARHPSTHPLHPSNQLTSLSCMSTMYKALRKCRGSGGQAVIKISDIFAHCPWDHDHGDSSRGQTVSWQLRTPSRRGQEKAPCKANQVLGVKMMAQPGQGQGFPQGAAWAPGPSSNICHRQTQSSLALVCLIDTHPLGQTPLVCFCFCF